MKDFYLVQRLKLAPYVDHKAAFPDAKVKSNPFGYGRYGDYELDYMGAAEFEWGAIPEANNRLAKAGKDLKLAVGEREYRGRSLDFLWIGKEGDPWEDWLTWANGDPFTDEYGSTCKPQRGFEGKERPWDFEKKLTEPGYEYGGDVWWALTANVQWAFHDENGHLLRMLQSMATAPTELLR